MDRLNTELNNRIDEIKKRFSYIQNNYSGEFKKDLILYDIIISYLNKIDCILDDYELNNMDNINIDEELDLRIKENKKFRKIIKNVGPLILFYNLNTI